MSTYLLCHCVVLSFWSRGAVVDGVFDMFRGALCVLIFVGFLGLAARASPISSNYFVNRSIDVLDHHYYQYFNSESAVQITLITQSGDADLYASTTDPTPNENSRSTVAYSRLVNPSDSVIVEASGTVFIGVFGYAASVYSLIVEPINTTGMLVSF